jgi:TetR/AcrR family transcriptional regulator, repressor for neighboring sulfatase
MTAVRKAAVELLSDRSPRDVTVRDIADRAGVNHALVHRHFGTKDDLLRGVIRDESATIGAAAAQLSTDGMRGVLSLLEQHATYWRLLARTVLDAPELLAGQPMPAASMFLGAMGRGAQPSDDTRAAAAAAASLVLGWVVFGPHLSAQLGITDDERVRATLSSAVGGIVSRGTKATPRPTR